MSSVLIENLAPKGKSKWLVINTHFFKELGFRYLITLAIDKLNDNLGYGDLDPWISFGKRVQSAMKRVGPIVKREQATEWDREKQALYIINQFKQGDQRSIKNEKDEIEKAR